MTQENITEIIIQTINSLFGNFFSSIDNQLYSLLDTLTFIDTDILNHSYLESFLGNNLSSSLLVVANSLLIRICCLLLCEIAFL